MEVQSQPLNFNFIPTGGRASPCSTAAGKFNFISAPASPSRASEFYREFDDFSEHEFAFHVGKDHAGKASVAAEDLFDHGLIRSPMAPQSKHRYSRADTAVSLNSPLLTPIGSPKSDRRKSLWSTLTSKRKKHNILKTSTSEITTNHERGRGWGPPPSTSSPRARVARSLSPPRAPPTPSASTALTAPAKSSRRWKLKNFLLFRSASEGRGADKDPLRKLTSFYRRSSYEDLKASATQKATDINKSNNIASTRKGPPISAHERHYTTNKAVSEDLKKKTFLPYKQGILGRLAVNPNVHALAHGFGSVPNG